MPPDRVASRLCLTRYLRGDKITIPRDTANCMLSGAGPRQTLSQLVRLGVAVPAWIVATSLLLGTLLPGFLFWWVLAGAFLLAVSVVGLAFVYAGQGTIPSSPLAGVVFGGVRWVPAIAIAGYLLYRVFQLLRSKLRSEAASMLADTRPPTDDSEKRVYRVVERLCHQVGLPTPTVRIRDGRTPLCYTLACPETISPGIDGSHDFDLDGVAASEDRILPGPVLVVSTGLVEVLRRDELTAVLAHEVAHLRNRDLTLMTWLLIPVHWSEAVRDLRGAGMHPLIWLLRSFAALPALAIAYLGAVTFSRGREFAADAAAAKLTGDPAALASALERLSDDVHHPLKDLRTGSDDVERPTEDLRAVHVLNVLPALDEGWAGRLSHPPTARRIDRLRALQTEIDEM